MERWDREIAARSAKGSVSVKVTEVANNKYFPVATSKVFSGFFRFIPYIMYPMFFSPFDVFSPFSCFFTFIGGFDVFSCFFTF